MYKSGFNGEIWELGEAEPTRVRRWHGGGESAQLWFDLLDLARPEA